VVASERWAAAAVEEAEGRLGGFAGLSLLQAILAALGEPVLNGAGVADFFAGDAGDHHDLLLSRSGRLAHRQREQVEQGIEIGLLAQLLQADPVHVLQERLQKA
jgi:hypothetical protein